MSSLWKAFSTTVSPATSGKLLIFRVNEAGQFVCVADPDPHQFKKLDPDPLPHQRGNLEPYPDLHQSGKVEALEGNFGALDGLILGKK
jgi:hypothetical protein